MAKNTGTPSQSAFENIIAQLGKRAYIVRFPDAKEIKGRTGASGYTVDAPSDYILTINGLMEYAEVKSTVDPVSFSISKIRTSQWNAARKQLAAGGDYWFYIHSLELDRWYRVPAQYLLFYRHTKKSHKWSELEELHYRWIHSPM
jgi:penicillin-binding protein-related factor A (putative recombinase)